MTEGGRKEREEKVSWGTPPDPRQEVSCTSWIGIPKRVQHDNG